MATDNPYQIIANKPYENLNIYQENSTVYYEEQLKLQQIEAANQQEGNINWLGSSYSGADIKVIAHLYQEFDYTSTLQNEINKLQALVGRIDAFLAKSEIYSSEAVLAYLKANGRSKWISDTDNADTQHLADDEWSSYFLLFVSNQKAAIIRMTNDASVLQNRITSSQDQLDKLRLVSSKATTTFPIGNLQTLSVQSYRDKRPVRALGSSYVKSYTRGTRTIAGSMIFTVLNENAVAGLIRAMAESDVFRDMDSDVATLLPDQLPPIDFTIAFVNEYGTFSKMGLYGVEFMSDGMTLSIEDIITEEVFNFVARDMDVMTAKGNIKLSQFEKGMFYRDTIDTTASSLLHTSKDSYEEYLRKIGIQRNRSQR